MVTYVGPGRQPTSGPDPTICDEAGRGAPDVPTGVSPMSPLPGHLRTHLTEMLNPCQRRSCSKMTPQATMDRGRGNAGRFPPSGLERWNNVRHRGLSGLQRFSGDAWPDAVHQRQLLHSSSMCRIIGAPANAEGRGLDHHRSAHTLRKRPGTHAPGYVTPYVLAAG